MCTLLKSMYILKASHLKIQLWLSWSREYRVNGVLAKGYLENYKLMWNLLFRDIQARWPTKTRKMTSTLYVFDQVFFILPSFFTCFIFFYNSFLSKKYLHNLSRFSGANRRCWWGFGFPNCMYKNKPMRTQGMWGKGVNLNFQNQ